jgi:predicted GNAT family N-acyltransferase
MQQTASKPAFVVREAVWTADSAALAALRRQVFINEQHVPEALEWDGLDGEAAHLLAIADDGTPIGCARLLAPGRIGRMAVLEAWRRCGVGSALLHAAIAACHMRGWHDITLSAQTHALAFYARAGFVLCSDEYLDAGIPHRDMKLDLSV